MPLGLTIDQVLKATGIINECIVEYQPLCRRAGLGFLKAGVGRVLMEIAV
jgi:hypothetical protein